MDSMVDRFRKARKAAGLSQKELADKLCMTQAHISAMEKGIRDITDRTISDICRELGISESWLRDGDGEMFASGVVAPSIISDLTQEYDLDAFDQALISEYLKLDKPTRAALKKKVKEFLKAVENAENDSIEKEVDAYREELKAEKRETSSASGIGSVKEA